MGVDTTDRSGDVTKGAVVVSAQKNVNGMTGPAFAVGMRLSHGPMSDAPRENRPGFSAMRGERGNGIAKILSDGAGAGIRAHPDTGMRVAVKWAAKAEL